MFYQTGSAVQFQGRGGVKCGVVVQAPRRGNTYVVRTTDGQQYKVPGAMLKAAAPVDNAAELVAEGHAFMDQRRAVQEQRAEYREEHKDQLDAAKARAARQMAPWFEWLRVGDIHCYLGTGGTPNVMVLKLHPEEGKVTISNPKAMALELAKRLGADVEGIVAKGSVKVWANRLRRLY